MKVQIRRIYVEKKKEYAVEAQGLLSDLKHTLGLKDLTGVRIVNRYDLAGITDEDWDYIFADEDAWINVSFPSFQ